MLDFQQTKQQVLRLFEDVIAAAKIQINTDLAERLEASRHHLAEEKIYVVVCGEFKQGKSSLINAFIDETNLFPVDVKITTNLVSTITYADREKITVVLGNIGKEQAKEINRSEIPEYVTEQQNKGNNKNAKMLIIESPNPYLKDGLVLVDTPGIGSLNAEHTALTYSFIPNADVILFVSDIQAPFKVEDLNFIKQRIVPHCQNIIFVVTKIDATTNYQQIIDSNRAKLATALNIHGDEICIIPVSSKAKQDYLKYQDPEDLSESHFDRLQEQVWLLVKEKRGQILILKALTELGKSLIQIKRPLEVEWQSYQQRSQAELDRWEEEIQTTQKRLQDLLQNNAEWQTSLRDGLENIRADAQNEFRNRFVKLQRQSYKYLDDPAFLNNPEQIATLLEADIDAEMIELSRNVNSKSTTLYGALEKQSGLDFNPFATSSLDPEQAHFALEEVQINKTSAVEKAVILGRTGTCNASAGAFVGGLVGGICGGIFGVCTGGVALLPSIAVGSQIGGALGGVAGTVKGAVDGIKQIPKEEREFVRQEIAKILKRFLEDSQHFCTQALNKVVKIIERSMRDELTNQIKSQKDSYDRTLQSLQQARKLSQEQANRRASQLTIPLEKLMQIQQKVEQLAIANMVRDGGTGDSIHRSLTDP
jgi:predicted GTPase